MMAALKLHSKATQLSNFKRQRVEAKSTRVKSEKKPKTETPIVIRVRRSLRTRGNPLDCEGLDGDSVAPTTPSKEKPLSVVSLGLLSMATARESAHSDSSFIESLMGMAQDIYTSCYDGVLGLMDAEKEIFDLVFQSDETIYALS
ncbi:hypothetical protein LR48_Vigan01g248000 [Vigna angularis]|uniref:Uncharacterized protein n=1 Tax=Phaseolus angularis TaxID=3914 RepID=A0A0L9TRZ2_PHAAN|nr:hypothetical protein LR48_Vigan01g248000 [Vigna angularis]